MTDKNCGDDCIDCNPNPAQLGASLTLDPEEWTPLDDNGTEIWLYGDQPVTIVVRSAA